MSLILLKSQGFKFLNMDSNGEVVSGITSGGVRTVWQKGVWQKVTPPTQACLGLNCSRTIDQAIRYVRGNVLAIVEFKGKVIEGTDKLTCEYMRIIELYHVNYTRSINADTICQPENIVQKVTANVNLDRISFTESILVTGVNVSTALPKNVHIDGVDDILCDAAYDIKLPYGGYIDEYYVDDYAYIAFNSPVSPAEAAATVTYFRNEFDKVVRKEVAGSTSSKAWQG